MSVHIQDMYPISKNDFSKRMTASLGQTEKYSVRSVPAAFSNWLPWFHVAYLRRPTLNLALRSQRVGWFAPAAASELRNTMDA
jgi:hypothetical protein